MGIRSCWLWFNISFIIYFVNINLYNTYRTNFFKELLNYNPTVIRGNASEIIALCGNIGNTKGVDSADPSEKAIDSGINLAKKYNCIVAISGEVDYITDGNIIKEVHNGVEMMTKVTALGCSLNACIACCIVKSKNLLISVTNVNLF